MELGDIKPDEKLIKFRKSYREQIDGWYNGSLHVAIIYSIGGLLLYSVSYTHLTLPTKA